MTERRWERLRRNEKMFREVNERMADVAEPFSGIADDSAPIEFVCECSQTECLERVEMQLEEYRSIRRDRDRFLVLPGHETLEIEEVVERTPGYLVVRKRV